LIQRGSVFGVEQPAVTAAVPRANARRLRRGRPAIQEVIEIADMNPSPSVVEGTKFDMF
jgi:hypothetical protein